MNHRNTQYFIIKIKKLIIKFKLIDLKSFGAEKVYKSKFIIINIIESIKYSLNNNTSEIVLYF